MLRSMNPRYYALDKAKRIDSNVDVSADEFGIEPIRKTKYGLVLLSYYLYCHIGKEKFSSVYFDSELSRGAVKEKNSLALDLIFLPVLM